MSIAQIKHNAAAARDKSIEPGIHIPVVLLVSVNQLAGCRQAGVFSHACQATCTLMIFIRFNTLGLGSSIFGSTISWALILLVS